MAVELEDLDLWYFFIGEKGITFGKALSEEKPIFSVGKDTYNVTLSKPFRGLFDFDKEQIIPKLDLDRMYPLDIIANGKITGRARVFLHDWWGHPLTGVIPARMSFILNQQKNRIHEQQAQISDLRSTNLKLLSDFEREKKRWMQEMDALKKAAIIPMAKK